MARHWSERQWRMPSSQPGRHRWPGQRRHRRTGAAERRAKRQMAARPLSGHFSCGNALPGSGSWLRRRLIPGSVARQRDTGLHPRPEAAEETVKYDKRRYKRRNRPSRDIALQCTAGQRCEIMFGRLQDWRRVATRYDRCPKVFLSAIALAAIVIYWL